MRLLINTDGLRQSWKSCSLRKRDLNKTNYIGIIRDMAESNYVRSAANDRQTSKLIFLAGSVRFLIPVLFLHFHAHFSVPVERIC